MTSPGWFLKKLTHPNIQSGVAIRFYWIKMMVGTDFRYTPYDFVNYKSRFIHKTSAPLGWVGPSMNEIHRGEMQDQWTIPIVAKPPFKFIQGGHVQEHSPSCMWKFNSRIRKYFVGCACLCHVCCCFVTSRPFTFLASHENISRDVKPHSRMRVYSSTPGFFGEKKNIFSQVWGSSQTLSFTSHWTWQVGNLHPKKISTPQTPPFTPCQDTA